MPKVSLPPKPDAPRHESFRKSHDASWEAYVWALENNTTFRDAARRFTLTPLNRVMDFANRFELPLPEAERIRAAGINGTRPAIAPAAPGDTTVFRTDFIPRAAIARPLITPAVEVPKPMAYVALNNLKAQGLKVSETHRMPCGTRLHRMSNFDILKENPDGTSAGRLDSHAWERAKEGCVG